MPGLLGLTHQSQGLEIHQAARHTGGRDLELANQFLTAKTFPTRQFPHNLQRKTASSIQRRLLK
jgi:hypothetical protein